MLSKHHTESLRLFVFSFFILVSTTLSASIPNSDLVGYTKGSFSVTPSGSASYSIPIQNPPSVGSVAPSISLNYDSSAGNGLLGMGWSLGGLSSITRCPTTLERDGYIDGVDFDDNDQWCLDGQRLVNLGGGEYRTEMDGFQTISKNSTGFEVIGPDGSRAEYKTKIYAQGTTNVSAFALTRIRDTFGSGYRVEYVNLSQSVGEYVVDTITLSNGYQDLGSISFDYEVRLDEAYYYSFGSKIQFSKRLSSISVFALHNEKTMEYELVYKDYQAPENISYLSDVRACDAFGECLEELRFGWEGNTPTGFNSDIEPVVSAWGSGSYTWSGDFDGNGSTDIASATGGNIYMKLANKGEFTSENWTVPAHWGSSVWTKTGDFNGDGLTDIASAKGGNVYMKLSTGSSFDAETWPVTSQWGAGSNGYVWVADFDGDGRDDIASARGGNVYMKLSEGDGFRSEVWAVPAQWGSAAWTFVADFNGDGLADIGSASGGNVYMKLSTGKGFKSEIWSVQNVWGSGSNGYAWARDFNGDGLADIASAKNGYLYMKYSTGNGFVSKSMPVTAQWGSAAWTFAADFNGDGMTDIASASGGNIFMKISEGNNGFRSEAWPVTSQWGSGSSGYVWVMDTNGDGFLEVVSALNGNLYVKRPQSPKAHLVKTISTGENLSTEIAYGRLTEQSVYQNKGEQTTYRKVQVKRPQIVVSEIAVRNGAGGTNTTKYSYKGLRFDNYAKRSLGFEEMTVENTQTGIRSITHYQQTFPFIGMPSSSTTQLVSNGETVQVSVYEDFKVLNTRTNSTSSSVPSEEPLGLNTYFPYHRKTVAIDNLLSNSLSPIAQKRVETINTYNNQGQISGSSVTTTGDGKTYTATTTNTYENHFTDTDRRQGMITRSTVISKSGTAPPIPRTSEFEYNWSTGKLDREIIEPDNPDHKIRRVTAYKYDSFGNRTQTTSCNGNAYAVTCDENYARARFSTLTFDAQGLYATHATNALGQTVETEYDKRFGKPKKVWDINRLLTQTTYDSLGRAKTVTNPMGTTATTTREWCDSACPIVGGNQAHMRVITTASGKPTSVVYFDQYQREIRKQTQGFDGRAIYVDTEYDALGRVKRTSEPRFHGESEFWNTPTYDGLGRKIKVMTPQQDGTYDTTSEIFHEGYLTRIRDAKGREVKEWKNAIGKVVLMRDKAANDTEYEYDSLGNLHVTRDSDGNEVVIEHDVRNRKTSMTDPDMGYWTYQYNTFDQLIEQTDAKGQRTHIQYDVLGRRTHRTDLYGTASAKTSRWIYDTASGKGKGKLYLKMSANGDYTRFYYGSTYGERTRTLQRINGHSFNTYEGIDSLGRVDEIRYPSSQAYSSGLLIQRQYNSRGFLLKVFDNTKTYWEAESMTARGQLEAASLGNGVVDMTAYARPNGWRVSDVVYKGSTDLSDVEYRFDEVGNITDRFDYTQNTLHEHFDYDSLDRLTDSTVSGGPSGVSFASSARGYGYDDLGNITSKSDIGTYSYTGCNAGPHAVCSAGNRSYQYDGNGNLTRATIGSTATIVGYTPFNKPTSFTKGSSASVTFFYDADRQRNRRQLQQGGDLTTHYYVGINGHGAKLFERQVKNSNTAKDIHYIYGLGGQAIATHVTEGSSKTTEYLHRDHLGSVVLTTNESGAVASRNSFHAFGKRRNGNWSNNSTGAGLQDIVGNIGFGGHESIPEMDLVHMNGRVYDPAIGRFLSADPIIQAPYNSQSYNRYSYVMNNPLSLVDPSGYSWISKKWKQTKKKWTRIREGIKWLYIGAHIPGVNPLSAYATFKAGYNYRKAREMGAGKREAFKAGFLSGAMADISIAIGFATGGPVGAAAALGTDIFLSTGTGRSAQNSIAKEVFHDLLGIGDKRFNKFAASVLISQGISWGVESAAAAYLDAPVVLTQTGGVESELAGLSEAEKAANYSKNLEAFKRGLKAVENVTGNKAPTQVLVVDAAEIGGNLAAVKCSLVCSDAVFISRQYLQTSRSVYEFLGTAYHEVLHLNDSALNNVWTGFIERLGFHSSRHAHIESLSHWATMGGLPNTTERAIYNEFNRLGTQ